MKRLAPRFSRFQSVSETAWFLAVTGLLVPALSAIAGAWLAHSASGIPYWSAWRDWYAAHALGLVSFSPPLLLIMRARMHRIRKGKLLETLGLLGAVFLAAMLTFGQNRVPLVVVPIVPMIAATFRLGRLGAVASVVILMAVGLTCSLVGYGPTALLHISMTLKLEVLQIYFASVVLILLPLTAALEARQRLVQQLRSAEALHRLIMERTSDVMMRLGVDGTVRYVSPASARLLGYQPHELTGRIAYGLVHEDDLPAVVEARGRALSQPDSTETVEYRILRKDGVTLWVESHMCAMLDQAGAPNGTVTIIRDATQRRQMMDDLSRKAMTDPLTGLCNRRAFDNALAECMDAERLPGKPGCLAIFDLDHFKRINDAHGHATGDRVLVLFAAVLRGTVRAGDVVARLGGEEFAVLLEGASVEQARLVCERIRVRLAGSEGRSIAGDPVHVTVSVGLAPLTPEASAEDVFKAADTALYRAKNSGRNRLSVAA
jgi:diguanylate cyclase (GGDEF)-like protein/PAS domain S-box-containing protein